MVKNALAAGFHPGPTVAAYSAPTPSSLSWTKRRWVVRVKKKGREMETRERMEQEGGKGDGEED